MQCYYYYPTQQMNEAPNTHKQNATRRPSRESVRALATTAAAPHVCCVLFCMYVCCGRITKMYTWDSRQRRPHERAPFSHPTHPRGADVYTTTQTTTRQSTEPDVGLHMPLHLRETPQAQRELQQYSVAGTIEGGMAAYSRRPIPCRLGERY